LNSAKVNNGAKPGSELTLNVDIVNEGFGNGAKYILNVIGDDSLRVNRSYFPKSHETKLWNISGGIPLGIPLGKYDLLLN